MSSTVLPDAGQRRSLKMEFNVAQLLKQPIGAIREYEVEEDIEGLDPGLVPLTPLTGEVKLLRTHSGILARCVFQVLLEVICNRCLEPVERHVEGSFEESFRPLTDVLTGRFISPKEFEGQEEELTDSALLIDDHHIMDMTEVLRQNIWLSMPMYPGCAWRDPENCPNFAQRLEEIELVHEDLKGEPFAGTEGVDPRWAALLALKNKSEEESS
jgi:uncharacterized protein